MTLDPDEKALLESVERGEWKPTVRDDAARIRELARQQLRVDVHAGFDQLARGEGRSYDPASGRRLAARIKTRGRAMRSKTS